MYKLKNLAKGTLNAQLLSGGTSLTLESGEGAKFPDTGSDNVFVGVLWGSDFVSPEADSNAEFVTAYRTSGDTFTLVRAQEGTSASQWEIGDLFSLVASSAVLNRLIPWADSQTVKTSNYTFTGAEEMNSCWNGSTSGGSLTFSVNPNLFSTGFELHFAKGTADANTLTLDAGSGNNINGSQTIVISRQYEVLSLVRTATSTWRVKSSYINETQYPLLAGRDGDTLAIDQVKAYDSAGLLLTDDGNNGIFVEDGGNVGINTTTPSQKLDIAGGSLRLDNTTYANQDGIIYKDSAPLLHNFNYGDNGTVTTYGQNLFIGENAGNFTMGSTATVTYYASYNTGIGPYALRSNTTGHNNVAIGPSALRSNTTGYSNSALGLNALYSNTTGYYNTAVGMSALSSNTTGFNNSAVGVSALYTNTGSNNSAVGMSAGRYIDGGGSNETGSNSLFLGYDTRAHADGETNQIVIGASAIGLGSNTVVLGNDSITTTALKGNVGVGLSTAATARLQVKGAGTTSSTTNMLLTDSAGTALLTVRNDGAYAFNGGTLGLAQTGWTTSNVTTDRTYDANATTLDEIADVLGTLIGDLKTKGIISA